MRSLSLKPTRRICPDGCNATESGVSGKCSQSSSAQLKADDSVDVLIRTAPSVEHVASIGFKAQ
ncbi:unnamed protein product [Bathycoccus prasinos]